MALEQKTTRVHTVVCSCFFRCRMYKNDFEDKPNIMAPLTVRFSEIVRSRRCVLAVLYVFRFRSDKEVVHSFRRECQRVNLTNFEPDVAQNMLKVTVNREAAYSCRERPRDACKVSLRFDVVRHSLNNSTLCCPRLFLLLSYKVLRSESLLILSTVLFEFVCPSPAHAANLPPDEKTLHHNVIHSFDLSALGLSTRVLACFEHSFVVVCLLI